TVAAGQGGDPSVWPLPAMTPPPSARSSGVVVAICSPVDACQPAGGQDVVGRHVVRAGRRRPGRARRGRRRSATTALSVPRVRSRRVPPSPVSPNANVHVHEKSIKPPSRARQAAATKLLECNTSSCGGGTRSTTKPAGAGGGGADGITNT